MAEHCLLANCIYRPERSMGRHYIRSVSVGYGTSERVETHVIRWETKRVMAETRPRAKQIPVVARFGKFKPRVRILFPRIAKSCLVFSGRVSCCKSCVRAESLQWESVAGWITRVDESSHAPDISLGKRGSRTFHFLEARSTWVEPHRGLRELVAATPLRVATECVATGLVRAAITVHVLLGRERRSKLTELASAISIVEHVQGVSCHHSILHPVDALVVVHGSGRCGLPTIPPGLQLWRLRPC